MTGTRALALAALLLPNGAACAWAGDTQAEFVPEVNAYLRLSDRTRLFLLGRLTQGLSEAATDGEVGAHLDITLTPILRRRLRDADWERERKSQPKGLRYTNRLRRTPGHGRWCLSAFLTLRQLSGPALPGHTVTVA